MSDASESETGAGSEDEKPSDEEISLPTMLGHLAKETVFIFFLFGIHAALKSYAAWLKESDDWMINAVLLWTKAGGSLTVLAMVITGTVEVCEPIVKRLIPGKRKDP